MPFGQESMATVHREVTPMNDTRSSMGRLFMPFSNLPRPLVGHPRHRERHLRSPLENRRSQEAINAEARIRNHLGILGPALVRRISKKAEARRDLPMAHYQRFRWRVLCLA